MTVDVEEVENDDGKVVDRATNRRVAHYLWHAKTDTFKQVASLPKKKSE